VTAALTDPTPWSKVDPSAAAALVERIDEVVDELALGVTASIPVLAATENAKLGRDVREAVRVAIGRFASLLGTSDPALTPEVREVFVGLGAGEAREDRGTDVLLAALRIASRLLLRTAVDALGRHRPVSADEAVVLADAVNAFLDELVAATTDGYALQVRELAGERDRRRHRLAELLLGGGAAESVVADAAAAVGWSRLGRVAPVLLPAEEAREARFRFGSDGVVVERGEDVVAIVRDGSRLDRGQLTSRLRGRGAVVGPTGPWADLPEAVRLTELTARLVRRGGTEPIFVDDHLATLALKGEPAALAALSSRWLAPFSTLPEAQGRPLLVTLYSWLRHWGARAAVAEELFVHPQTVSYRIKRARWLVGPDLDDPRARFELLLVLADLLGEPDPVEAAEAGA